VGLRWIRPGPECDGKRELRAQTLPPQILEEFVNTSDDPERILRFTEEYGPLLSDSMDTFAFSVEDWRRRRDLFRKLWEARSVSPDRRDRIPDEPIGIEDGEDFVTDGEHFLRFGKSLFFKTRTLERLLDFELMLIPAERLRRCPRPHCRHPYFIARHRGKTYCSVQCADWAQLQSKNTWWNKTGSKQRRARAAQERRSRSRGVRKKG
jgi:hypothetical protein